MKKTKIVCTIGPATADTETLQKLIQGGMNVARVNMSHGDYAEHEVKIKNIRTAEKATGTYVGILLDLAGPKIRTGDYTTPTITLTAGKMITLTTDAIIGTKDRISINYKRLPHELRKGSIVMLDDGRRKLVVHNISGNDIHCKIVIGGEIKPRRGVNIPNGNLSIASLTAKDKKDLIWGLKQGVDFVALSFVRTKKDVQDLERLLKKSGKSPQIIAKIETAEAIDNLDGILEVVDGVMVARGDLAIETPREKTPIYQKEIVRKAIAKGKFTIVATQMMESMILAPTPTRAEVSDVANAIFEGADAVMTSEETSLGKYPIETVSTMAGIAIHVEHYRKFNIPGVYNSQFPVSHAIAHSAQRIAESLDSSQIVVLTETGRTPREIAQFHGIIPILALTPNIGTARTLSVIRGVTPYLYSPSAEISTIRPEIQKIAKKFGSKKGDTIIIASGSIMRKTGSTNMLIVETIA